MQATSRRDSWSPVIAAMVAAALGVVGFFVADSVGRSATARSSATVSMHKTAIGTILAAGNGRTLYLFGKDRNGKSTCSGSCAQYWPPLLSRGKPTAGAGVKASLLGTTRRSDGSMQVTYNKHPLYTFTLDKQAGQTHGEGVAAFGAKWYVVSARGSAIVAATATTGTTVPTTTTANTTTSCSYPPCP